MDGIFISLILVLQGYSGSAMSTKQKSLVLPSWPSLHSSLLSGFVNTSSLYSYVPRNVKGPQSYLWDIELYCVVFLHKAYLCRWLPILELY